MKRFPALILPLLLLTGCGDKTVTFEGAETFGYKDFAVTRTLTADQADTVFDGQTLLNPSHIFLLDSLLLTRDSDADFILNVFSLKDKSLKGSFLKSGKGPYEEVSSLVRKAPQERKICAFDFQQKKMLTFAYDQIASVSDGLLIPTDIYTNLTGWSLTMLPGERFLSGENDTLSGPSRIKIYDRDGNLQSCFGEYPGFPTDHREELASMLLGHVATVISDDGKRLMLFGRSNDLVEIWDLEKQAVHRFLQGPELRMPEYIRRSIGGSVEIIIGGRYLCYSEAISAAGSVWALYDGSISAILDDSFDLTKPTPRVENNSRLLRFDWEGRPLACYQLPCPVKNFDVDERGEWLYCLTKQEGEFSVIRFPL